MKKILISAFVATTLTACAGTVDHMFPPKMETASASNPAPYSAPRITENRKVGNPYEILGQTYYPVSSSDGYRRKGIASWYGKDFHAKKTANGETYDMYSMTAAHPTLPLPTYVRVTNLDNGLSVVVRVNDRGPFLRGRIIDLSYKAAIALDMHVKGTAPVLLEALPTDGSALLIRSQHAEYETNVTNAPHRRTESVNVASVQPTPTPSVKQASGQSFTHRVASNNRATGAAAPSKPLHEDEIHIGYTVYYIQTGAFTNKDNALQERKNVSRLFENVKVMSAQRNGADIHRVRVGPVQNVTEADKILASLVREGWIYAQVVVD